MKLWKIDGTWQHKITNENHQYVFEVVSQDDSDPLETLNKIFDMSGMIYLHGSVSKLENEDVFCLGTNGPHPWPKT